MNVVTVLIVQHLAAEAPYKIVEALAEADVAYDIRHVYKGDTLPTSLAEYSALVVMGGPMSAYSDENFPTRNAEIALCREAIDSKLPLLGVCLGAQLLAVAAGAKVYAGHGPEIGWGHVTLSPPATQTDLLFAGVPQEINVLHWHGDTFDLPPNATLLMSNNNYTNQAFRIGDRVWGLQFHCEINETAVEQFVTTFEQELSDATVAPIRENAQQELATMAAMQSIVFSRFAQLC